MRIQSIKLEFVDSHGTWMINIVFTNGTSSGRGGFDTAAAALLWLYKNYDESLRK